MKKIIISIFLSLIFCSTSFSQNYNSYFGPDWAVDLGFNNFLEDGEFPSDNNQSYGLNNFGSRYVAGSGAYGVSLIKNALDFRIGLELGIHNFMFENNNYITRNMAGDSVNFSNYQNDFQEELEKSKLVVSYLSLPASFRINLGSRKGNGENRYYNDWLHIDLGGYVGYRLSFI